MMSGVRSVVWVVVVLVVLCCTPSHAHPGGSSCEDQQPTCDRWAATGWCQTRRQYMQEICPVSCNLCGGGGSSCQDLQPICDRWAATGWCLTRRQYMQQNCPVSCNLCGGSECIDSRPECGSWAQQGDCVSKREQMLASCPHSCGVCDVVPAPPADIGDVDQYFPSVGHDPQTITNPDFICGRGYPATSRTSIDRRVTIGVAVETTQSVTRDDSGVLMMMPGKLDMMGETRLNKFTVEDAFCGATPITDRFLLTAAHCAIDPERPVRTVRLGELDFAKDNEQNSRPVDYEVEKVIIHPQYIPVSKVSYKDLALIQTVKRMAFNEVVFPYCLSAQRPVPKTILTTAGFGKYNATFRSSRLKEKELELVDSAVCEETYRGAHLEDHLKLRYPKLFQGSDVMCAVHPRIGACKGDSGGPLFLDTEGRRFLVGVVSTGVECSGASVMPGLYISVADHIDFIDSVVFGAAK